MIIETIKDKKIEEPEDDIESMLVDYCFSKYDEDQEVIDDVLASNSLKRFQAAVKKHGQPRITALCKKPKSSRVPNDKIMMSLNSKFIGEFI